MTYILVRKSVIENAESRQDRMKIAPGEALAILKTPHFPVRFPIFSGLCLEEITETEYETYEVFGITALDWEDIAPRADDFNSWIFSERIRKALKRNGDLA